LILQPTIFQAISDIALGLKKNLTATRTTPQKLKTIKKQWLGRVLFCFFLQ
jgi:hypothetical protein